MKTVCSHEPGWWQLAYTDSDTLVGLVMPARNDTSSIIGYIGVVPEQRGNGYINDLLHGATTLHYENGARRIVADTDVENIPMANAFRRGGYKEFDKKLRYTIDL